MGAIVYYIRTHNYITMAKKKKIVELSGDLYQQFIDETKKLNPGAHIVSLSIKAHSSLWEEVGMNAVRKTFYPTHMTPENMFTVGIQYNEFAKLFNHLYNNSKHITGVRLKITKHRKCGYVNIDHYIGTDKEWRFMSYNVVIEVDGITPEAIAAEQALREKREREEQERIERNKRREEHIEYYKNLNKDEVYENLGYANGWMSREDEPEIVKIADADPEHFYECYDVGRCLHEYVSHKYKFTFMTDSSD